MVGKKFPSTSFKSGHITAECRDFARIDFVRKSKVVQTELAIIIARVIEDRIFHPVLGGITKPD